MPYGLALKDFTNFRLNSGSFGWDCSCAVRLTVGGARCHLMTTPNMGLSCVTQSITG